MRRYMLAICILSVFYFALAAPVPVGEKPEVRSDAVDEIVVWEKPQKRRDSNPRADDPVSTDSDSSDARSPPGADFFEYFSSRGGWWRSGGEPAAVDNGDDDSSSDDGSNDEGDTANNNNNEPPAATSDDYEADDEADDDDTNDESDSYDGENKNDHEMLPKIPEHMTTMAHAEELLDPLMHKPRNFWLQCCG